MIKENPTIKEDYCRRGLWRYSGAGLIQRLNATILQAVCRDMGRE